MTHTETVRVCSIWILSPRVGESHRDACHQAIGDENSEVRDVFDSPKAARRRERHYRQINIVKKGRAASSLCHNTCLPMIEFIN
jgi:hypothetical protein